MPEAVHHLGGAAVVRGVAEEAAVAEDARIVRAVAVDVPQQRDVPGPAEGDLHLGEAAVVRGVAEEAAAAEDAGIGAAVAVQVAEERDIPGAAEAQLEAQGAVVVVIAEEGAAAEEAELGAAVSVDVAEERHVSRLGAVDRGLELGLPVPERVTGEPSVRKEEAGIGARRRQAEAARENVQILPVQLQCVIGVDGHEVAIGHGGDSDLPLVGRSGTAGNDRERRPPLPAGGVERPGDDTEGGVAPDDGESPRGVAGNAGSALSDTARGHAVPEPTNRIWRSLLPDQTPH